MSHLPSFTDKREAKKYLFDEYYCFTNKKGETLRKCPGEIDGQEFQLTDLVDCTVEVLDCMDRVIIDRLEGCRVFMGPTSGTVIVRNSTDCEFVSACKEFRISDSSNCVVRVMSPSPVILEDSSGIKISIFNGAYSGLISHFEQAELDYTSIHQNVKVSDFSERNDLLPKPHYTRETTAGDLWSVELPGATGPPEYPLDLGDVVPSSPPPPLHPTPSLDQLLVSTDAVEPPIATSGDIEEPAVVPSEDDRPITPAVDEEEPPVAPSGDEDEDPFGSFGQDDPFADSTKADEFDEVQHDPFVAEDLFNEPDPFVSSEFPDTVSNAAVASYAGLESGDALSTWKSSFDLRVKTLDASNATKKEELQEKAEEDLDEHYAQRTTSNSSRFTLNREAETEMISSLESSLSEWAKVVSLINVSVKDEGRDLQRMRSLLLQLKNC